MLPMNSSRSEKSAIDVASNSVAICEPTPVYARAALSFRLATARSASAWARSASTRTLASLPWTSWSRICAWLYRSTRSESSWLS